MFGEPGRDGVAPPLEATLERVGWWAEIFETPCVAYAARLEDVAALAAAGADFVALGDAVWARPIRRRRSERAMRAARRRAAHENAFAFAAAALALARRRPSRFDTQLADDPGADRRGRSTPTRR